jgi:hypothetical protein
VRKCHDHHWGMLLVESDIVGCPLRVDGRNHTHPLKPMTHRAFVHGKAMCFQHPNQD